MASEVDWTPVVQSLAATNWTAVLVAIVTGCAAVAGPVWVWYSQVRRERAGVRAALLVEVGVLIELIELRDYLGGLRDTQKEIAAMTDAQRASFKGYEYAINVVGQYNRVYQANVSRLGGIPQTEATKIVRFYQLADSVIADVSPGGILFQGSSDPDDFGDAADILEEVIKIGRDLTAVTAKAKWWHWN